MKEPVQGLLIQCLLLTPLFLFLLQSCRIYISHVVFRVSPSLLDIQPLNHATFKSSQMQIVVAKSLQSVVQSSPSVRLRDSNPLYTVFVFLLYEHFRLSVNFLFIIVLILAWETNLVLSLF